MNDPGRVFWENVYIAMLRQGLGPDDANEVANAALDHWRRKFVA